MFGLLDEKGCTLLEKQVRQIRRALLKRNERYETLGFIGSYGSNFVGVIR